ncbi:MAG: hypothetical protein WCG31_01480 [Deltaproteobacteria bacterium]
MRNHLGFLVERFKNLESRTRLHLGAGVSLFLLLVIILSYTNERITLLVKKRSSRESDLVQMMTLKQRYLSARTQSSRFQNRITSTRADDSPAKIIEEAGFKGKIRLITPIKGEDRGEFLEDAAEVKLEGLTANDTVNLLYRLQKGTRPVSIKKVHLKVRFDDPAKLDMTLAMALLKTSQQGRR